MVGARIDFAAPDGVGPRLRHAFADPCAQLVAHTAAEVRAVLDAVQAQAEAGRWCVGFLRYEAAAAFDPALAAHAADGPLAWFGVYDEALPWPEDGTEETDAAWRIDWDSALPRAAFDGALAEVARAIAAGEVYQVNYTAPLAGHWSGDTQALFAALRRAQPGGYAAFLDTGGEQVLSVSPELFFDWQGGRLLARPMKGTAPRGATPAEDAAARAALQASPKERAENVMVVDMLRNDLSRVADPFSVQVPRLFCTEALPTVWQMTSDVQARTRAGCTLADVFAALFPCGSVTGAPKVQAMRMVRALEPQPRGVYCGAVGVVRPGGHATFNVPIRTVVLAGGQARCGIGSGLVADAQPDAEWREWRHKRAFLDRASAPFQLLETFALHDGQARSLPEHLERMAAAATHFGIRWQAQAVQQCVERLCAAHPAGRWRARLLLDRHGRPQAEAFDASEPPPAVARLQLASVPFEAADSEFVRFKTTRRAHYDAFAPAAGVFDTLLWNTRGEITEGTRCNVALQLDGRWLTPPLHCGLLGGVGRAHWLREGRVAEGVVRLDDLPRVQALAVFNSLRGWIGASLAR
ncbi:aminodeoxychorismate synthase component I [Pseudorhodoferax sp.]|uniref:aminodeoxychorismate synthase component I n=1 Tax=Pseudorhodoferax sp. TaxID=1993553 RepID=UPI002DD6938C|nr:aminodeoxychorismate synthase component I [Pseudorhodoferax sp.]